MTKTAGEPCQVCDWMLATYHRHNTFNKERLQETLRLRREML